MLPAFSPPRNDVVPLFVLLHSQDSSLYISVSYGLSETQTLPAAPSPQGMLLLTFFTMAFMQLIEFLEYFLSPRYITRLGANVHIFQMYKKYSVCTQM